MREPAADSHDEQRRGVTPPCRALTERSYRSTSPFVSLRKNAFSGSTVVAPA